MKKIQISDHFTITKILLFSLPSIGMQLVDNTYQVADGYFISNYLGPSPLAAENMIFPPLALIAGIGLMFGSGAGALISQTLGEGDGEKANRQLSLSVGVLAVLGVLLSALFYVLLPTICGWIGATEELVPLCMEYGHILAICMPFQILNGAFHPLLIAADRPGLGLIVSIVNAAVNIVLDWLAVAVLGWGMTGAALATGLAWVVSALIPLIWFAGKSRPLHYGPFRLKLGEIGKVAYNGASEMADAISYAFIAILFNNQLVNLAGEFGVVAYGVSEYVSGIFTAIFFGIAMSITPVVGYHLGQNNRAELRAVRKNGIALTGLMGVLMALISFAFAPQIAGIFVGYEKDLLDMAVTALRIICASYLLAGITTFSSAFFTGMGDGTGSLSVALCKGFIVPLAGLLILPRFLGLTGIWLVTPLAEVIAAAAAAFIFLRYRRKGML